MDVETLSVSSRKEWRGWLARNHRVKKEVWLIYYSKGDRGHSVSYRDFLGYAVEEAICYGWIDSRVKRLDRSRLALRFTPRRSRNNWSKYNRARALKLLGEGKMTEAGIRVLPFERRMAEPETTPRNRG